MPYHVYLGSMLLPVTPEELQMKIANQNKSITLADDTERNILKPAGLTEITFDALLPNVRYPFAVYKAGFEKAPTYTAELERLKISKQPFQFIVTRIMPNGKPLFDTNIKSSLEEYTIKENVKNAFDVMVSVKLKQYVDYGTRECKFTSGSNGQTVVIKPLRPAHRAPISGAPYVVAQDGETLWTIAKKIYGDGGLYGVLYSANSDVIENPNIVPKGTELWLPSAGEAQTRRNNQ